MPYSPQPIDPVPGATPNPAGAPPIPEASGARPARLPFGDRPQITDEFVAVCDRWVLMRRGRAVGVCGWSVVYGWFAAARGEDGSWVATHRPESERDGKRQVVSVAGRGRWVFAEASDAAR